MFYNIICPNIAWFWKLGYSRSNLKEVWYTKNLFMKFLLTFPELFIIEKYVKIRFKNRGSPCYFLSSRGQKIKNITKIEQKRLFLFTFLVSFFMAFLAQKLIYTINIWFNFVFGSFFQQDHLLNLFISGVYAKRWPKCARISIQKLRTTHWAKKYGGAGLVSEKTEALYAELNKTVEAATSSYFATGEFVRYIYILCLWLRIIRRSDQGV